MIRYNSNEAKIPAFPRRKISNWIKSVAFSLNRKVGEVSYIFCSDQKILEVNQDFLSHDFYTDVITFDYSSDNIITGDIFISIDTVQSNAIQYKTTFINELYRVIIHGILHLCGMRDKTVKEKELMRKQENVALSSLINYL